MTEREGKKRQIVRGKEVWLGENECICFEPPFPDGPMLRIENGFRIYPASGAGSQKPVEILSEQEDAEAIPKEKRTVEDWIALGLAQEDAEDMVWEFGDEVTQRKCFPDEFTKMDKEQTDAELDAGWDNGEFDGCWDDRLNDLGSADGLDITTKEQYEKELSDAVARFKGKFPALPEKGAADYGKMLRRWKKVARWVESPLQMRVKLGEIAAEDGRIRKEDFDWYDGTNFTVPDYLLNAPEDLTKYGG